MRWFPFSSFHVHAIALYLSDHTLAVLSLSKEKQVISFGSCYLADNIVIDGKVLDRDKLVLAIRELCAQAQPKPVILDEEIPVILSVPESQSFTHLFTVPSATPPEKFKETVFAKARELIPMDMTRLYWDWHIAERAVGAVDRVLFASAPREIIDSYIAVCEKCNMLPVAIDMETTSLARALLLPDGKTSIIMDIGARTTTLGFFDDEHRLGLSVSIPIAGNSFTNSIVERIHVSWDDAESLKRQQGLSRAIPDNRVLVILQERMQAIMHDFLKALNYYESTYRKPIVRIVLSGGSALLPDIVTYFGMNFKREVVMGEPFHLLGNMNPQLAELGSSIRFAPVVGLALRTLVAHPESEGINLLHGWEGERWEEREEKILKKWRLLAVPLFISSCTLLAYVVYAYLYLPYVRLQTENTSRVTLLSETAQPAIVQASSTVTIAQPQTTEVTDVFATTTNIVLSPMLRIKETPTGYLNVRRRPASTSPSFARVYPGENYELLAKENGWVKIKIKTDEVGWVSGMFIEEKVSN